MENVIKRDCSFDLLKGGAIILVVLGHFIEPFRDINPAFNSIFIIIYCFHMPLFCFISGFFSKRPVKILKILTQYIFLQLIYLSFQLIFDNRILTFTSLARKMILPYWHLWYLYALSIWRVSLIFLDKLKNKILVIVLAVCVSLASGFIDLKLGLTRVVVFYPFFLFGYLFKKDIKSIREKLKNADRNIRRIAAFATVALSVCIGLCADKINANSLFNRVRFRSKFPLRM